ncbi:hypothetical protein MKJ04_07575 [Pontibacter sp. E15-1]|uniref:hypothetical protein n=1 Tax=Pontibacter sp. E15-1 TaxID=2919918 RepID=UPI001F4F835F|nr:hypothetical protein [Pontibacter sp. E15-1]MCJ8164698.1 hypothetical protein [Pontibacter sp. E15-1]
MFSEHLPAPILFHPLKHHLGYIKAFVERGTHAPEAELKAAFRTIGRSQLDLYIGALPAAQVAEEVLQFLKEHGLLQPDAYRRYIASSGAAHRVLPLSDASAWVLRWGVVPGRHVHIHPGRYARYTLRVKANVLKIALAAAITRKKNSEGTVIGTPFINEVRAKWLALPPVKDLDSSEGLVHILSLVE